jgi:hypothetical protein
MVSSDTIYRSGFSGAGDGGAATYVYTPVPCSITGGDNGSQVRAGDGGCLVADFSTQAPSPKVWGCAGDGSTTACFQAAILAVGNGRLYIGGGRALLDRGRISR